MNPFPVLRALGWPPAGGLVTGDPSTNRPADWARPFGNHLPQWIAPLEVDTLRRDVGPPAPALAPRLPSAQ